jgi:uncharacterized protein YfdQ (DUF2303 family)
MQTATLRSTPGDAQACLDAGQLIGGASVRLEVTHGVPAFVVKDGFKVELHPELLPRPTRHTGTLPVANLESFCRHFKKYANPDSVILVDADPEGKRGANFIGILNYHHTGDAEHCDFRVTYTAKLSVEWNRWMSKNGKLMGHTEFLEHLEDVKDLIKEPDGAGLLDLISSLEGKVSARFENALNLHNGRMKLAYSEDVELKQGQPVGVKKGDMEVPTEIVSGIAPFEFGTPYRVENRLRYRIQNRSLCFAYEVVDAHKIIFDAVKDQVAKVLEATEVEPLYGLPPTK